MYLISIYRKSWSKPKQYKNLKCIWGLINDLFSNALVSIAFINPKIILQWFSEILFKRHFINFLRISYNAFCTHSPLLSEHLPQPLSLSSHTFPPSFEVFFFLQVQLVLWRTSTLVSYRGHETWLVFPHQLSNANRVSARVGFIAALP